MRSRALYSTSTTDSGGEPACLCWASGFDSATEVDTGGLVFPGLIDLHNHMAYNCLSLWVPPDRDTPWITRDQWPRDAHYKPDISLPANALCHADAKAVLKYVETKAVIGGVTAIQGSAKLSHPFEGFMVRNVEFETFQTGKKTVNQSVRAFTSPTSSAPPRRTWPRATRSCTTFARAPTQSC